MTSIRVYRRGGVPCGIEAVGHSGYAESGSDIVCAAVSVLFQTLEIGLSEVVGIAPVAKVDPKRAFIELRWSSSGSEAVRVLTESVCRALAETARSYSDYVKYAEVSL